MPYALYHRKEKENARNRKRYKEGKIKNRYIKKGAESRQGKYPHPWNKDKKGNFPKGEKHPRWKGGISKLPEYDKMRYTGKRKEDSMRRNRNRTKDQMKNEFIKSVYGITLQEFDKMVENQNGVCAICGNFETRKSRYGGICRLTIDHEHKSKKVRGLLCHACNSGIGYFKDDVVRLEKAITYLNKQKGVDFE